MIIQKIFSIQKSVIVANLFDKTYHCLQITIRTIEPLNKEYENHL